MPFGWNSASGTVTARSVPGTYRARHRCPVTSSQPRSKPPPHRSQAHHALDCGGACQNDEVSPGQGISILGFDGLQQLPGLIKVSVVIPSKLRGETDARTYTGAALGHRSNVKQNMCVRVAVAVMTVRQLLGCEPVVNLCGRVHMHTCGTPHLRLCGAVALGQGIHNPASTMLRPAKPSSEEHCAERSVCCFMLNNSQLATVPHCWSLQVPA